MKSIQIENSIELETTFKCFFNKNKWKVHPTKQASTYSTYRIVSERDQM